VHRTMEAEAMCTRKIVTLFAWKNCSRGSRCSQKMQNYTGQLDVQTAIVLEDQNVLVVRKESADASRIFYEHQLVEVNASRAKILAQKNKIRDSAIRLATHTAKQYRQGLVNLDRVIVLLNMSVNHGVVNGPKPVLSRNQTSNAISLLESARASSTPSMKVVLDEAVVAVEAASSGSESAVGISQVLELLYQLRAKMLAAAVQHEDYLRDEALLVSRWNLPTEKKRLADLEEELSTNLKQASVLQDRFNTAVANFEETSNHLRVATEKVMSLTMNRRRIETKCVQYNSKYVSSSNYQAGRLDQVQEAHALWLALSKHLSSRDTAGYISS